MPPPVPVLPKEELEAKEEELHPWRAYVPPPTMPRRDLAKEFWDRLAAKEAEKKRNSWGALFLPTAMFLAYVLGTYVVSPVELSSRLFRFAFETTFRAW